MAGPGPWSVKGVDETTRAIAREAAGRAGLPIGVWVDRAILKSVADREAPSRADAQPVLDRGTTCLSPAEPVTDEPVNASDPPEPARPAVSPLDGPVRVEERTVSTSTLSRSGSRSGDRNEVMRYGLGGAAALILVVVGITALDRIAFAPEPIGAPSVAAGKTVAPPPDRADRPSPTTDHGRNTGAAAAAEALPQTAALPSEKKPVAPESRIDRLQARAAAGDVAAELELGLSYIAGMDVPRDDRQAAEWLEKAAVQGSAPAQFNLAVLYERGRGVPRDMQQAFFWYRSAADQGYTSAEHNLATLYATGNGVAQNYAEAKKWFTRAADAGNPQSLYSLGLMHEHGLGIARDMAKAQEYYRRAAERGSPDARSKLEALAAAEAAAKQRQAAEAARLAATTKPTPAPPDAAAAAGADQPLDRRQTAELQRLLALLDFAPGAADGVAGRRTTAAIRLYEEFAGLPVDGKPTRRLLDDLRAVAAELHPAAASSSPKTSSTR